MDDITTSVQLKKRDGTPREFHNISKVMLALPHADGEEPEWQEFSLGGTADLPQLNAPTAISDVTNLTSTITNEPGTGAYITVTNPTTNGNFATGCQLLIESTTGEGNIINNIVAESNRIFSNSFRFYASDWLSSPIMKTPTIKARFINPSFKPSTLYTQTRTLGTQLIDEADGAYGMTSMIYNTKNLTISPTPDKVYWGQNMKITIVPEENYYLPKTLKLEVLEGYPSLGNMIPEPPYTYDNTTGTLSILYNRAGPNVSDYSGYWSTISIIAEAANSPWLKDFSVSPYLTDNILTIPCPDNNAERAEVQLNTNIINSTNYTLYPAIWTMTQRSSYRTAVTNETTEGNNLNSKTTYTFKSNGAGSSGYTVYRCTFICEEETEIVVNWQQYGYSSYNCGYISTLDCTTFGTGSGTESSSECLFYGPNYSGSTQSGSFTITIPSGTHYIDIKWRGYYNYTQYYFSVSVDHASKAPVIIDLSTIPQLQTPGTYTLQVTAEAEGYTGADPIEVTYTKTAPAATVEGTVLNTQGTVENNILTADGNAVVNNKILTYNTST